MIITFEMIFIVFSAIFLKPFLRDKIDPMPLRHILGKFRKHACRISGDINAETRILLKVLLKKK
jgi:hypothetical protein